MLQKMHDHMKGIVTVILFGILAVVFIFWGIERNAVTGQAYAAKVNGDTISIEKVRKAYQERLAQIEQDMQRELPVSVKDALRAEVMENKVREALLMQRSQNLRYRASMSEVVRIFESTPAFQINGKFDKDLAQRQLRAHNLSTAEWEADTLQDLRVGQLLTGVTQSQFLTPRERARAAALMLEEREVSYAVVPAARYVGSIAPTDAEINAYFEAHKNEFLTEETVALEYVELKRDDLAAQAAVTEDSLRKFYADNIDRYKQKERRQARHLLVSVTRPEDDAAALKKADDLYKKLQDGADFAALVKQSSDDVTSQPDGGDLGWHEIGGLEPALDDAIFAMQLHELHAPVKSKFGYHILRLDGIEPAKQSTFEEVRPEIEPEFRASAGDRDFGERQEKLADLAFSTSGDLSGLAAAMKLEIKRIAEFTRNGGGGALGANKAVIAAAFSDEVLNGSNSEPVEIAPGDIVVLRSSGHKSAEPRALADVSADIVTRLKADGAREQAKAAGEAVLETLKSGAVWDQALSRANLTPTPRQYVPRSDATLPGLLRDTVFASPRPQGGQVIYRGVEVNDGDYALIAFSGVRDGSAVETPEQRDARVRRLAQSLGVGDIIGYTAELERTADIKRNDKAIE